MAGWHGLSRLESRIAQSSMFINNENMHKLCQHQRTEKTVNNIQKKPTRAKYITHLCKTICLSLFSAFLLSSSYFQVFFLPDYTAMDPAAIS